MNYQRFLSTAAYVFFGLGGVISLFFPYKVIESVANTQTAYVWAAFMAIGGFTSAVGVFYGSWTVEQIGLPLLTMCFITLAVIALSSLFMHGEYYASSGLFSLGNVSFFLYRYLRIKNSAFR